MPDLNDVIQNWRDTQDRRVVGGAVMAELEDHLRAEADTLITLGLPADEAVLVAAKRIGRPLPVSAELLKADPGRIWRQRVVWLACGYLLLSLGHYVIPVATRLAGAAGHYLSLDVSSLLLVMMVVFWSGYGLLLAALWWAARGGLARLRLQSPGLGRAGRRLAAAGLGLLALFPGVLLIRSAGPHDMLDPQPFSWSFHALPGGLQWFGINVVLLALLTGTLLLGAYRFARPRRASSEAAGRRWVAGIGQTLLVASVVFVINTLLYLPFPGQDADPLAWTQIMGAVNAAHMGAQWLFPVALFLIARSAHRSGRLIGA